MNKLNYGGAWTEKKLEALQLYLSAYLNVLKGRSYQLLYVDAFAGPGSWEQHANNSGEQLFNEEHLQYKNGSPLIALDAMSTGTIKIPFNRFYFMDNNAKYIDDLRKSISDKQRDKLDKIQFITGDANAEMEKLCDTIDWSRSRAVVFLDPFGMTVNWSTIEAIAATKAIDLWVLFPVGVAVNRMLVKTGKIPSAWGDKLDELFGTSDWHSNFYGQHQHSDLFQSETTDDLQKVANFESIADYYVKRLKTVFAGVVEKPLMLKNSRGNPLFSLCFAAGNPRGYRIAIKIAKDILDKRP